MKCRLCTKIPTFIPRPFPSLALAFPRVCGGIGVALVLRLDHIGAGQAHGGNGVAGQQGGPGQQE